MIYHLTFFDPQGCSLSTDIENGKKTVEGRPYSPKFDNFSKGDTIVFDLKNKNVICTITYIKKYKSLRAYLTKETLEKTIPCANNINDAVNIYNNFSSANKRQNLYNKYGFAFIAIGIKYISTTYVSKKYSI